MTNSVFGRSWQAAAGLALVVTFASCTKDEPVDMGMDAQERVLNGLFTDYELVQLDVAQLFAEVSGKVGAPMELDLGIPSHPTWRLALEERGRNADEPIELVVDGQPQPLPVVHSLVGTVGKSIQEFCSVTLGEGFLSVYLQENGSEFFIEPLFAYVPGADPNLFVVYNANTVRPEDQKCETNEYGHNEQGAIDAGTHTGPTGLALAKANCKKPTVLATANYSFYQRYGSNLNNCYAALTAHVDQAAVKYWSNSSLYIDMYISKYYILTYSWDIFDSNTASTLLSNFRFAINTYYPSYNRNINILFTGHDFSGTGIAYVAKVCNSTTYNYAVADANINRTYAYIAKTAAHETGHLYSATDETSSTYIMGAAGTQCCFSTASKNLINAHKNANNCTGEWACG